MQKFCAKTIFYAQTDTLKIIQHFIRKVKAELYAKYYEICRFKTRFFGVFA